MGEITYTGGILRVDLSTGKTRKEQFAPELLPKYVGGAVAGIKLLYDEVPPDVKPFDPENRFILGTGP